MNPTYRNAQEWVQAHINGQLSKQECLELSHKIETDTDFAEEFAILLAAKEVFRQKEHAALNKLMTPAPRRIGWKFLVVAASFLVISISTWLFWPQKHTVEIVLKGYEEAAPIHLMTRSATANLEALAEKTFNAHNYEKAAVYLAEMLEIKDSHKIQLYRQQALRLSGQEVDLAVLDDLIAKKTYKQMAQWEKVLVLFSKEKWVEVKPILQEIALDKENPHQTEAKGILKQLSKVNQKK